MIVTENLNQIINDLRFICAFAEEYHCQFDGYYYWKDEEKKCEEYLKKRSAYVIWGVVLTVVGVILAIYGIVAFYNFLANWDEDLIVLKILAACIGIPTAPIGVGMFMRGTVLSAKKEKDRKEAVKNKEFFKAEIERYKTSSAFAQQRDIYVTYFPDCKVRKSDIDYLILVMQTGRATTFKDALLLLDKKKYDDEMKDIAEKTMEYAKKAALKPSSTVVNNYYR